MRRAALRYAEAYSLGPVFQIPVSWLAIWRWILMRRVLAVVGCLWAMVQVASAADRLAEFETLAAEYDTAVKAFHEAPFPTEPTTADKIRRYEAWPGWRYIPRFVALAEAQPDDEAALRSCQWIIDRTNSVGNEDKPIFEADQKAWDILAAHHTGRKELPPLCLQAVQRPDRAQERFLRGLRERKDLSRDAMGFATVALGELLAHKFENCGIKERPAARDEFVEYLRRQWAADWAKDLTMANAEKFKAESIVLFRETLERYADVPVTITAPDFRDLANLGEKASKSLHALEHLTIGSEAPDIVGKDLHGEPLDLRAHRGSVVVVSFWFTGCGPCIGMIPQEQRLIETYKGRPFALLGVCTDDKLEQGQKTAAEHEMAWPCWFDGGNGPIARDWNVLHWPTIYVLDRDGRIVAKDLRGDELDAKIAQLMEGKK